MPVVHLKSSNINKTATLTNGNSTYVPLENRTRDLTHFKEYESFVTMKVSGMNINFIKATKSCNKNKNNIMVLPKKKKDGALMCLLIIISELEWKTPALFYYVSSLKLCRLNAVSRGIVNNLRYANIPFYCIPHLYKVWQAVRATGPFLLYSIWYTFFTLEI